MGDFYSDLDLKYTEVAVLMTTCNKYEPGEQTFYLQSMVPLKDKSINTTTTKVDSSNIVNEDKNLGLNKATTGSNITLKVPREIARYYPKKWIPPGTRFIVSFMGGDITKPQIVGGDF